MTNRVMHTDSCAHGWVKKADTFHDDPIARFMFLWIAFNACYSDEMQGSSSRNLSRNRQQGKSPSELDSIHKYLDKNIEVQPTELEKECFRFFKKRDPIKNLTDSRSFRFSKGYTPEGGPRIYDDIPRDSLKGYLSIIYTVRCNLFHGHKWCYDEDDIQILENAADCLKVVLNKIV